MRHIDPVRGTINKIRQGTGRFSRPELLRVAAWLEELEAARAKLIGNKMEILNDGKK